LLGSPEVRLGDSLLVFPTRKTLALLIYLALEGEQQRREHLATLLWPEVTPERSYASLRNTLGHLQSTLRRANEQTQYLSVSHGALALNPEADITLDLNTVERAYMLARADRSSRTPPENSVSLPLLQAASDSYRGEFLIGFSLSDAPAFDDWATNQREMWGRRMGLIHDRLSEIQFANGDFATTAETASRWIALDTLNEAAYRRKMRAHFAAGERGQALDTYEAGRIVLAAELGAEPEPDTQALAAQIRTQYPLPRAALHHLESVTPVEFLESLYAGRTDEHQVLVERYELAVNGQPQIVVIRGEAGMGKTRLAREFLRRAEAQGAGVLQARAFESGSRTLYQPLVEALRPLFEQHRAGAGIDVLREAQLAPLTQLLPELRAQYSELSSAHEEGTDRGQVFEALVRLTLALSEQSPLVLFIDDLQWADRATLDWLIFAARRWRDNHARLFLLICLRTEALQPPVQSERPSLMEWLSQIEREQGVFDLELDPLSGRDTIQMLLSVLTPPAAEFAEWVFDETHGHPFYLMETLKDLLERKAIHPRLHGKSQWVFEVDAEHDLGEAVRVPSTVRAVIRSRFSRLSPNAFSLLAAGAVLEQHLTFENLCAVANVSGDLGLSALDELISSRLLLEVEHSGIASTYGFANNMIRDVIYTEAGDARRRLFHKRAIDLLEASGAAASVLAHHAIVAGLSDIAIQHSLTAGQEALRLADSGEAKNHLDKARQLAIETLPDGVDNQPRIRDLYRQLAEVYESSGQPQQAQAIHDELQQSPPL
jgi:DNA-binding SARP family transcriptional activator